MKKKLIIVNIVLITAAISGTIYAMTDSKPAQPAVESATTQSTPEPETTNVAPVSTPEPAKEPVVVAAKPKAPAVAQKSANQLCLDRNQVDRSVAENKLTAAQNNKAAFLESIRQSIINKAATPAELEVIAIRMHFADYKYHTEQINVATAQLQEVNSRQC